MKNLRANGLLLLAAFFFGSGNFMQQNVMNYLGPMTIVGLRCLIASAILLPWLWNGNYDLRKVWKDTELWGCGVVYFFGAGTVLVQMGIGMTTVINTSFIINTWTVLMPLCMFVLFRVLPSKYVLIAAVMTLIGSGFISGGVDLDFNFGDLLCALSALAYALWGICLSEFLKRSNQPLVVTLAQFLGTGILCLTLGLSTEQFTTHGLMAAAPEILMLGIFSTGLGYVLAAMGQASTSACEASIILSCEAIFGAIGGVIMLNEKFDMMTLVGGGMILSAALIVQLSGNSREIRLVLQKLAVPLRSAKHADAKLISNFEQSRGHS